MHTLLLCLVVLRTFQQRIRDSAAHENYNYMGTNNTVAVYSIHSYIITSTRYFSNITNLTYTLQPVVYAPNVRLVLILYYIMLCIIITIPCTVCRDDDDDDNNNM